MHTVHTFSLHFHAVKPCTNTTWENLSQYAKDKQPNCNYNETDQLMLENNTEWKISALPMWQCHFYYSCIRHCTSGGSRRGDEGLHPHRHTAIFAREMLQVACLFRHHVWQIVTTRSNFWLAVHKNAFGDRALPGPIREAYSTPETLRLYLRGPLRGREGRAGTGQ